MFFCLCLMQKEFVCIFLFLARQIDDPEKFKSFIDPALMKAYNGQNELPSWSELPNLCWQPFKNSNRPMN